MSKKVLDKLRKSGYVIDIEEDYLDGSPCSLCVVERDGFKTVFKDVISKNDMMSECHIKLTAAQLHMKRQLAHWYLDLYITLLEIVEGKNEI